MIFLIFPQYNHKKILVTGHTGFKGSWLTFWLKELGADVIGFALDPYTPNDFFNRTNLKDKIIDIRGNILNLNLLLDTFQQYQPDFVFHLAAQPIVRLSYDEPLDTFQTNIIGTANLLEAIRQTNSVHGAILVTTDKVYQNKDKKPGYREIDPLGGHDPYSASKACAEIVIDSYIKSFFQKEGKNPLKIIGSVRAGNVIGGGDWQQDRLIPDCIRSLINKKPISVRNPLATRPWQYVLDALSGYLLLGERFLEKRIPISAPPYAHAWNFGPLNDSGISVRDLVQKVIEVWGSGEWVTEGNDNGQKHEATQLALDISKANNLLDWHPVLNIDDCVRFTIKWYKEAHENAKQDMYNYSKHQIGEYINLAKQKQIRWIS